MYERNVTAPKLARQVAVLAAVWWLMIRLDEPFWIVWITVGTVALIVVTIIEWRWEAPLRDVRWDVGQPLVNKTRFSCRPVTYVGPGNCPGHQRVRLGEVELIVSAADLEPAYVAAAW
jgi:hypothetical protein